ncbi:nonstructural protein [Dipodfec virus RodF1_52]|uniref:Nonstructural protein n=1 Tax=Dipodfec virus RodF1_52 TaxID=2929301 RepID=A0A976N2D9_9VIRU|nr:nonstructural protein [Dipodfec virus RodF1_52]
MIYNVYCIRDLKVGFLSPVLELSDDIARRNFEHSFGISGTLYDTHPEDFDLCRVATFDSERGVFKSLSSPVVVDTGLQCSLRRSSHVSDSVH